MAAAKMTSTLLSTLGTGLHFDPDYADAWNTLISGHKWWTFLPPDLDPEYFECKECSKVYRYNMDNFWRSYESN